MALLRLQGRDQVNLAEVAELISTDASMASQVIRAANSAFPGVRGEVVSLGQAAAVLGLRTTLAIATAVTMKGALGAFWSVASVRRCWRHNLATAIMSDLMANTLGAHQCAAHTTGLLHDSGRLALVARYKGAYVRLLDSPSATDPCLRIREREAFGQDHVDAGLAAFDALGLPASMREAIELHHDDQPVESPITLAALVQAACRVVTAVGFGAMETEAPPPDLEAVELGMLSEADRRRLVPRLPDSVNTVAAMMEAFELVL